jgi:hypothetical protein
VSVRIEDIVQRIRSEIERASRGAEGDRSPVDADALPAISNRPELEYLNRHWSLFDPLSEMRSHRRLLGPFVLRFKWMFRRLVLGVLDRYFEKERLLLLELVRFNNALAERCDRLLREVTERTKAVAERNDLLLGALDLRVEALEAREEMRRGLEDAPHSPPSAEDRGDELRAEMAAALGGDVAGRVGACAQSLSGVGPVVVLGCGAGDVLEALRETAADLRGVESSAMLVRQCRARGFAVELAALRLALESLGEESLGGLVVTGVAERHREDGWLRLVACAWRSLRPGGVAIFEGVRDGRAARLSWLLARQRFTLLDAPEIAAAAPDERVLVARRPVGA